MWRTAKTSSLLYVFDVLLHIMTGSGHQFTYFGSSDVFFFFLRKRNSTRIMGFYNFCELRLLEEQWHNKYNYEISKTKVIMTKMSTTFGNSW